MTVRLFQMARPARRKWSFLGLHGPPELPSAARLAARQEAPTGVAAPSHWGSGLASSLLLSHSQLSYFGARFRNTYFCSLNSLNSIPLPQIPEGRTNQVKTHWFAVLLGNVHLPDRLSWQKPNNSLRQRGLFYLEFDNGFFKTPN